MGKWLLLMVVACGGPGPEAWLACEEPCDGTTHIEDLRDADGNLWRRCDCPNGNELIFRVVVPASTAPGLPLCET